MSVTPAQLKAKSKWDTKTNDKIGLRIRKDGDFTRDMIQSAADAAGESLNAYTIGALKMRMEKEGFL